MAVVGARGHVRPGYRVSHFQVLAAWVVDKWGQHSWGRCKSNAC